jgi:hypothetical protein
MIMSAVHPWLMRLREDIFKAKRVARPVPYHAWNMEWMVDEMPQHEIEIKGVWLHGIERKEVWLQKNGGGSPRPPRPIPPGLAALIAQRRASKNKSITQPDSAEI